MSNEEFRFRVALEAQNYVQEIAGNSQQKLGPLKFVHLALPSYRYARANMGWPLPRAAFVVFISSLKSTMTTGNEEIGDPSMDVPIVSGMAAKHTTGKSGLSVRDTRLVTRTGAHVALPL
jgi:hypothetical protein